MARLAKTIQRSTFARRAEIRDEEMLRDGGVTIIRHYPVGKRVHVRERSAERAFGGQGATLRSLGR